MRLPVRGSYSSDWPRVASETRKAAGFRCIRCGHRFVPQRDAYLYGLLPSPGKWSPCDAQCTHGGPVRVWIEVEGEPDSGHWWETKALRPVNQLLANSRIEARWRILTVHHLTGEKSDNRWWNLLALCQVCHLYIQGKVIPERPWLLDHTDWFKPYVAGFYASFYAGQEITREDAVADLPRWLALNPAVQR